MESDINCFIEPKCMSRERLEELVDNPKQRKQGDENNAFYTILGKVKFKELKTIYQLQTAVLSYLQAMSKQQEDSPDEDPLAKIFLTEEEVQIKAAATFLHQLSQPRTPWQKQMDFYYSKEQKLTRPRFGKKR